MVRQLKNRSNIQGVKKEDVLNLLIETFNLKGSAVNLKKEFYNQALANKFNLRRNRFARRTIVKWEKEKRKKEEEEEERTMLLDIMTEDKIEK